MKKIFISAFLSVALFANAQHNTLLEQNFWKSSPDVAAVKAEIAKGNNPAALNPMAFDPVVIAINNDAPIETIKFLIDQPGNSVSKSTHDSRIYLHWAGNKGNVELVNYLISKGSDINVEDSHGSTPIVFAVANGQKNTAIYEAFFKAGLNPNKKYKDGANLLLLGIANDKDLSLSNYFITKGLLFQDVDNHGNTAFNYAARAGNVELLKTLLQKGVKFTDNALILAAQGMRRSANGIEAYQYLVEELKIKPTVTTSNGQTVLHFIARKDKQAQIVKYFTDKGVDVNKADNEGNTALIEASKGKDLESIRILLTKIKNINAVNLKGESALTEAVKSSSAEVVNLLLSKGASFELKDNNGHDLAYHLIEAYKAPRPGSKEATDDFSDKLAVLKDKNVNLSGQQKDGSTLYHVAIVKNDLALLQKLAPLNIDVNAKNNDGLTVLHKAAMISKDEAILKYLLALGAKKDIKSEFDETAYDLAKENELFKTNKTSIEFLK